MSSRALSVPPSVPAPGRPALVRARRILHEGAATRSDIAYRVYVVVLLAAMFVVPTISGATASVPAERVTGLVWAMREWSAGVLVLAAVAPTHFGPVITYEGELHFLVTGPFGARRVLAGRTWTVLVAALVAVGALAGVVAAGLGLAPVALVCSTVWMIGTCALVFLGLLGVQTRWGNIARVLTLVLGTVLVVTGRRGGHEGWVPGGGQDVLGAGLLGVAVVLAVAAVPLALGAVPARVMEHDIRMRRLIGAGLTIGDLRALTTRDGPRRRWGRHRHLGLGHGLVRRSAAVSALELLRTPVRSLSALVVVGLCGAWVVAGAEGLALRVSHAGSGASDLVVPLAVLAPVALVAGQWAFGVLARALADVLETLGARRLDPSGFGAQVQALLAPPAVLVLAAGAAGAGAAGVLRPVVLTHVGAVVPGGASAQVGAGAALVLVLLVAPLTSLALMASGGAPLMAFTASPSPVGDMSSLWVVAWMLRGLAPAAVLTVLLAVAVQRHLGVGPALLGCAGFLLLACAVAAAFHLRHLAAQDRRAQGVAPAQG